MKQGRSKRQAFFQIAKVLWHLDIFRRSFRELSGHACISESCIFCALKDLFSQLQFSQENALSPDALRRAHSQIFLDQQRFQFGFMDDVAECFENILLRIHLHIANSETEDMCNARHCVPHQKFAMTLVEQSVCGVCGATSEPLPFTQMVHYVSASALILQAQQSLPVSQSNPDIFGQLLRRAGGMGDIRECPSSCGAKIQICRALMNCPEIISIGVVWDSEHPSLDHIMDVFAAIGVSLRLSDVFHSVVDLCWAASAVHNLVGVVTYYGKHYSTFFFHTKLNVWIYFDDVTVKEIGPRWEQVIDKCRRGRYQPLLLLYAEPYGTPVNTENAPKIITPFLNSGTFKNLKNTDLGNNRANIALKRSITPSPEKPSINNTARRAITPNPDSPTRMYKQKRIYSDYQNLTDIQNNIFANKGTDVIDGNIESKYINRRIVENVIHQQKKKNQLTRSLSTGSSPQDGISIPEHLNVARRRDSGNWSGDRNSASSSSSTTMDNPYLYIVNKMQKNTGISKSSIISKSSELSSSSSTGHYDAGYDSYSLSSTDSLPLQQGLKHNLQLAQIPEGYQQISSDDCKRLWMETDTLMGKAQVAEKAGDLSRAVVLCTAASSKAREAMNVPYSNSNTIDLAQKKHNFCVMRMSYLQKKIKQEQTIMNIDKDEKIEGKHSRENSKSGQHLRQSSRDKGSHSRQNSRELLINTPVVVDNPSVKSIEIYATLPKKKTFRGKVTALNIMEDEEYMLYERPTQKTGLFCRSKHYEEEKKDKKRARSEERNKNVSKEFSTVSSKSIPKLSKIEKLKSISESLNSSKSQHTSFSNFNDQKQGKKQHKIRRKLLMGGLIKRKNRSMPDLREDQDSQKNINSERSKSLLIRQSVDDSNIGLKNNDISGTLCGYLSEGHLEFTGISNGNGGSGNPNLERSRLMRKSFHGSVGKFIHVAKVPPLPPLRTTSQLSKSKLLCEVHSNEYQIEKSLYSCNNEKDNSNQTKAEKNANWSSVGAKHSLKTNRSISDFNDYSSELNYLPFALSYSSDKNPNKIPSSMSLNSHNTKSRIEDDVIQYANSIFYEPTFVITRADVHNEEIAIKQQSNSDSLPPYPENGNVSHSRQPSEELPPPPYPITSSVSHSQQASEDFPPPPPTIEDNNQIQVNESVISQQQYESQQITSLLAQLKLNRDQILTSEMMKMQRNESCADENQKMQNELWLVELRAKQAERQMKKQGIVEQNISKIKPNYICQGGSTTIAKKTSDFMMNSVINTDIGRDLTDYPRTLKSSVRDMAAKFEQKVEDVKSQSNNFFDSSMNIEDYKSLEESKPIKILTDNTNKEEHNFIGTVMNFTTESNSSENNFETSIINRVSAENGSGLNAAILSMSLTLPHENGLPVDYPEDDISEVAMQNTIQNTTILPIEDDITPQKMKKRVGKKKSVSFCDQVVLVATAEDDEQDSYIPNPILERVLRSAINKPETAQVLREIKSLQEAELNREINISMKFQQHTLPLKSEADSMPATPFQDQLRSVNPILEPIQANFVKPNSNEEMNLENKKYCSSYETDGKDIVRETFLTTSNNSLRSTSTPISPQFQQKIRSTQNGYPQLHQFNLIQNQNTYPTAQTSHLRNKNILLSQTPKSVNHYPISIKDQYIKNSFPFKNNSPKNIYSSYYQLEQQNNQTNRQLSLPHQQQQNINQRIQGQTISPITIQQPQQNIINQRIQNQSSSPITVQLQSQQPFGILNGQLTSSYQHLPQNSQYLCQGYSYHLLSQQRINQHKAYCQHPSNSIDHYPNSLSQQSLQNEVAITYQQKLENYQRQPPNMEQVIHLQSQVYSNGQMPLNIKYPNYQHLQQIKQMQQQQQIHTIQTNIKGSPIMNQNVLTRQKSPTPGTSIVTPCHLCRKKQVCESAIYCSDCDFYMSRFRPKN